MAFTEGKVVNKHIIRHQDGDVPSESYEAAWMEAKALLENAGPDSAFVLMIATNQGDTLDSFFALSSGRAQIPASTLVELTESWLAS